MKHEPSAYGDVGSSADYALRTAQQNLMHMSAMADQKASVVLGSSFIMAGIVFGDLAGDAEVNIVRALFLATALGAGLFAALALAPRLKVDPSARQPLFFGSIAHQELEDYQQVMSEILVDREKIHATIVTDLHTSSRVLLTSKFRPLQTSYGILIIGMAATLIAAIVT